jgi:hypothetical protein
VPKVTNGGGPSQWSVYLLEIDNQYEREIDHSRGIRENPGKKS